MVKHKKPKQLSSKKKHKSKDKQLKKSPPKVPSLAELLQAGDSATASTEIDKALAFYQSAADLIQDNKDTPLEQHVTILEKLGETKATLGDEDGARQDFCNAISLLEKSPQPTNPHYQETLAGLHLYVGQLSSNQDALEAYKKGLQCLETSVELREKECAETPATIAEDDDDAKMETEEENNEEKNHPAIALNEARQKLASARVTVAELYLTDLCFEENAESECEKYVTLALQLKDVDGEPMVDALQTAASLRLSQQRPQEARTLMLQVYAKLQVGCEALANLVGLGEGTKGNKSSSKELIHVEQADNLPSGEFRSQTAKLLLECGANATEGADKEEVQKCHRAAILVLASLLAENDEVPEIWYLLGCAFEANQNKDNAKYYWTKALEMLTTMQTQMEEAMENDNEDEEEDDDEMDLQLQNIACQMEEIKSKLEDLDEDANKMEE